MISSLQKSRTQSTSRHTVSWLNLSPRRSLVYNTESADFNGKHKSGATFDEILDSLRAAALRRDTSAFADAATLSASINQRFVPNPYHALLEDRLADFGALGINVGHTGTVVGLLFDAADDIAMKAAATASVELQRLLPPAAKIDITLTPKSPDDP